jgi:hypothetical protein
MILLEIYAKASLPLWWYLVSAALTAEFPQGYNLPFIFSAQAHANFSYFLKNSFLDFLPRTFTNLHELVVRKPFLSYKIYET